MDAIKNFGSSLLRAWIIGLTLVTLAVLLFILVAAAKPPEPLQTLGHDLAAALFTTGGVAVIFEWVLKSTFASEMIRLIKLRDHVIESGFDQIAESNEVDWNGVFSGIEQCRLVVVDPNTRWEWPQLLEAAKQRRVHITVYLPDPESSHASQIAERTKMDLPTLQDMIRRLARTIQDGWKLERDANRLAAGATVEVYLYDAPINWEVVSTDRQRLVALAGLMGATSNETGRVLCFNGKGNPSFGAWVDRQIDYLASANPRLDFSGEHRIAESVIAAVSESPAPLPSPPPPARSDPSQPEQQQRFPE